MGIRIKFEKETDKNGFLPAPQKWERTGTIIGMFFKWK
jgi:hypothetical protein